MSLLYRAAVFAGDVVNAIWPLEVPPQHAAADARAEAEALQEVWSPAATIRDVVDRLDDIRNQLHQLSARPDLTRRVDGADLPPAAVVGRGGGHPAPPDTNLPPGWSGVGPGGGDPAAPPGQPDRPLSELLNIAAEVIDGLYPGATRKADWRVELASELRDAAAQVAAVESEP